MQRRLPRRRQLGLLPAAQLPSLCGRLVLGKGRAKLSCPLSSASPCSASSFTATHVDRRIRTLSIRCPLGCDAAGLLIGVREKELKEHLFEHCPHRLAPCLNSCGEHHRLCDGERHLLTGCSNVPVACQYGCGQLVRPSDAFAHEQSCSLHRVPCPLCCFESAQQAALSLPASARQYYATADPASLSLNVLLSSRLDVLDSLDTWTVASVMRAEDEGKPLLVSLEAAHGPQCEYIRLTEGRECLAPLHRHTARCCPAPAPADLQSASSAAASSESLPSAPRLVRSLLQ